ncbi:MAG: DUF5683 domain-containing protein [Bacteroidales bacterium]|nr:DUF5683 domain-containing protein [Bacteroidales bacterium]
MKHLLVLLSFLMLIPELMAQDMAVSPVSENAPLLIKVPEWDSKKDKKDDAPLHTGKHDPKTATWLALIPGAGQAYNRKYWKMPIVYAGFAATGYFAISNGNDYRLYRDAYDFKTGIKTDVSEKAKTEAGKYTNENLITLRDYYRRNMELSWIIMAAWYVVQIIDASVDAYFFYYEIDDNLTMKVEPKWEPSFNDCAYGYGNGIGTAGISVRLNF